MSVHFKRSLYPGVISCDTTTGKGVIVLFNYHVKEKVFDLLAGSLSLQLRYNH